MERPISASALAQVQAAIFNGEKIAAIKMYRDDTGASLADAKDAVDRLEAEWRAASPDKFKAPPAKNKGCGICLLLVLASIGVVLLLYLLARKH